MPGTIFLLAYIIWANFCIKNIRLPPRGLAVFWHKLQLSNLMVKCFGREGLWLTWCGETLSSPFGRSRQADLAWLVKSPRIQLMLFQLYISIIKLRNWFDTSFKVCFQQLLQTKCKKCQMNELTLRLFFPLSPPNRAKAVSQVHQRDSWAPSARGKQGQIRGDIRWKPTTQIYMAGEQWAHDMIIYISTTKIISYIAICT